MATLPPPFSPHCQSLFGRFKTKICWYYESLGALLDALAWQYGLLILVSAGNIRDEFAMPSALTWSSIESASPETRQNDVLSSIVTQRSTRKLLSPAEAINVLTIGPVTPTMSFRMAAASWQLTHTRVMFAQSEFGFGFGIPSSVKPDC